MADEFQELGVEIELANRDDIDQRAFADDVVDLNFNYPSLPEQADLLRNALRGLASSGDLEALLRYQSHGGRLHERASVALHLERRGLTVPADQVLIVSGALVDDELFVRMQRDYDDDTIAELTMIIAWENASSRFNRAFRIPSQGFWKR